MFEINQVNEKLENDENSNAISEVSKPEENMNENIFSEFDKKIDENIINNEIIESDSQKNENTNSQPLIIDSLDSQPVDSQTSNDEKNKTIHIRPKRKVFFNRDRNRNKVEFNTKSFFSSNMKDEFDLELDGEKPTTSQPNNSEKKNVPDTDEDEQYIKLKKIKKAHQCHDLGETEQFDEDIRYYLSGIVSKNSKSMRCLRYLI